MPFIRHFINDASDGVRRSGRKDQFSWVSWTCATQIQRLFQVFFSSNFNKNSIFTKKCFRPTEFADPIQSLPFVPINDYSFPMASIPLPKLSSAEQKLSSDLPEDLMKYQHLKPNPIDAEILENVKMKGPIGYALNPKKTIRNIVSVKKKIINVKI